MSILAPILIALFAWWLATLLMMRRCLRARPRCPSTLLGMTAIAALGLLAVVESRYLATPLGAYLGFIGGLALWGWHEMSYFLGALTGPRPHACPPGVSTWRRFQLGVQASLWHELAVVATAVLLFWLMRGTPNQVGFWIFVVLWAMRWSAKLNIFLGVRNLHEEFWPAHLRYLGTFIGEPVINKLFPVSMALAGLGMGWLLLIATAPAASDFERTGALLLLTLLFLAALEHVFLVLRVPDSLLWRLATGPGDPGHCRS